MNGGLFSSVEHERVRLAFRVFLVQKWLFHEELHLNQHGEISHYEKHVSTDTS